MDAFERRRTGGQPGVAGELRCEVVAGDLPGSRQGPAPAGAMGGEPGEEDARDGWVTRTYHPGYRLGDRVIRPARVAVGKKA